MDPRPLPEETVALPYAELLTRVPRPPATAAFYVNKWDKLEDSARGPRPEARYLPKAVEVPTKREDTLAAVSGDLGKDAVKLREAAKANDIKDATDTLQRRQPQGPRAAPG